MIYGLEDPVFPTVLRAFRTRFPRTSEMNELVKCRNRYKQGSERTAINIETEL